MTVRRPEMEQTLIIDKPSQVTKFLVPAILSIAVILTPLFRAGGLDLDVFTVLTVLIAIGNAPVVFRLGGTKAKTIAQALVAGIQVIIATLSSLSQWSDLGTISYETWVAAALAAAGVFGVGLLPNAPLAEKVVPVSQHDADAADPKVTE